MHGARGSWSWRRRSASCSNRCSMRIIIRLSRFSRKVVDCKGCVCFSRCNLVRLCWALQLWKEAETNFGACVLGVLNDYLNNDSRLGRCVYIPNAGSLFWISTFSRSGKQAAGSRGYERFAQDNFRLASAVLLTVNIQGFLWVIVNVTCGTIYYQQGSYVCMYKYNVSIMMCIYSVQVSLDANASCTL